jgi:hypothetical protein
MITKFNEYIKENVNNNGFFTTYKETKEWLDEMEIENYIINDDLTVDVNDDVNLVNKNLSYIPIKFGVINGGFYCSKNNLISLVGSPNIVKGNFYCIEYVYI